MRSGRVRKEQRIQDNGRHKADEGDINDHYALTRRLNGRLFSCHFLNPLDIKHKGIQLVTIVLDCLK